ncbi:flavin-containing monooxygenase [uncultured Microbacterium sp.]|uniref:flavin-containing monooxygenase n=1 Tax=uncultured Microbacterium sp. TaxID=191216 RepID=UPI0035C9E007
MAIDSTYAPSELPTRYCIIGAGPAGLIAGRSFLRAGIQFDILERYTEVGGIWNIDQPGSPMYESCNFIASKKRGGFIGYPMPEEYPDFPTWSQIRDYIHAMAADYGLIEHVQFETEVTAAEPLTTDGGTFWRVTLRSGEVRDYRGVIYAGGHEWSAFVPEIAGLETFTGRAIHSRDYRSLDEFHGKRVLIVGAGNSGVDIASDAAVAADKAFLSTRRGYWVLPKNFFGVPTPDYIDGTEPLPDVFPFNQVHSEDDRIALLLTLIGDITRYGLPAPDHALTATHPIVSNTVLHFLAHNRLAWKPDVESISGNQVTFRDGSVEEIDVIVLATGYDIEIPFLADGLVTYHNGRPRTHLSTFLPELENFYTVGIMHTTDNGYQNFDEFTQLIVADIRATLYGENAEAVERLKHDYHPDLVGDLKLVNTRRNENQWNAAEMRRVLLEIERDFGIPIPRWTDQEFYRDLRVAASSPTRG